MTLAERVKAAQEQLDAWVREIVAWHFAPETGCPFWLEFQENAGKDFRAAVNSFADLKLFGHFQDDWLRDQPNERWVPRAYAGRPFFVFETGGSTGMPKQRISFDDHKIDYTELSRHFKPEHFPPGAHWLHLGPTGPRRLRLAIEHLANERGGACFHVDLDPRWVQRLVRQRDVDGLEAYKSHVIDQAVTLLKHRAFGCLFSTPKLIEALSERISIPDAGIKGVFCGGTSMTPQVIRFLVEECLEGRVEFVPVYGNTLMGLARSRPVGENGNWAVTYFAPQPRAVLEVVNPNPDPESDNPDALVPYGEVGRVMLTTLTKEFFVPRFLERDEAIRAEPWDECPWDGVTNVRPFQALEQSVVEGVY